MRARGVQINQKSAGKLLPSRPARVAVAIPSNGTWHDLFGMSLCQLLNHTWRSHPEIRADVTISCGSCLPSNRLELARGALQHGATHILWLDTDMLFPADTLIRLLTHDKDIVGAAYVTRRPPPGKANVCVAAWDRDEGGRAQRIEVRPGEHGLRQVISMGMGVLLVRTSVLPGIPQPWFEMPWNTIHQHHQGEDDVFFRSAASANIKAFADIGLSWKVAHMGTAAFGLQNAIQGQP